MIALTFGPDLDPMTPGVIVDGEGFIPTSRGYGNALTPGLSISAYAGHALGAAFLRRLDNLPRTFIGTQSALLERSDTAGGFADRSKSGGYNVVNSGWSFRQFGNVSLAAAYDTTLQFSPDAATNFADVSGAPAGAHLAVASGFVLLYRLATQQDGWACSALYDHADWTPDIATQAADGRFIDTPGPVSAAREMGDDVIVFKERSMYRHRYVGAPMIWASERISDEIGAICNEAVVDVGNALMFVGEHDIYLFDGTRPQPVGHGIREWFFGRLHWSRRWDVRGGFDRDRMLVYWWYPAQGAAGTTQAIVYSLRTGRWGHVSGFPVSAVLNYAFDTGFVGIADREMLCVATAGHVRRLNAADQPARMRLGWFGDDSLANTMTKIRPRFLKRPSAATARFFSAEDIDDPAERGTATLHEKSFDTQQNACWHSIEMTLSPAFEIAGIEDPFPRAGGRR